MKRFKLFVIVGMLVSLSKKYDYPRRISGSRIDIGYFNYLPR